MASEQAIEIVSADDTMKNDLERKSEQVLGPSVRFHSVNFTANGHQILSDVAGRVESQQLCGIIGASGSGKTSLLNILAGRCSGRPPKIKVSCYMEVDGVQTNPVSFRKQVAYVMQDDALLPTATPREALTFSATLRLSVSDEQRRERVEEMLKDLDLVGCADVYIGGELVKGISGGQRKRTAVGVELVTKPGLVFLDEPTSGLDSESALSCVKLLHRVASKGATVLCTIHQPSSEVFALFDHVLIMKDGRCMYQSSVEGMVTKFAKCGFPVPVHYNVADFVMSVATRNSNEDLQNAGFFPVLSMDPGTHSQGLARGTASPIVSGFWLQLKLLILRELQDTVRNKAALGGRFGVTIFLNLLFGLIFKNAGGRDDANPENLSSHFGALMMVTISSMFGGAQPIMLSFPLERPVFLREYTTGSYSCLAYFIAKALVELPLSLLQTLIQYGIVYPLLDLQGDFFMLVIAAWSLGIASSSVAVVMGCSLADVRSTAEMAPAVFVPQLLFAGFFVRISQIPRYLRWAQYLCALKYSLNILCLVEFKDCGANSDNPAIANASCKSLLDTNEIYRSDNDIYWGVLVVLFLAFRIIASFVLIKKAQNFY